MNIPQIRIQSSALLFYSVSEEERAKWADSDKQPMVTLEDVEEYALKLKAAWSTYERTVLESMVNLYGVEFEKPIIDIYVSPWNKSISNPLIINPSRPADIHIETIIHELLHVLFTDNTAFSMHDETQDIKLIDKWRSLFGHDFARKTLVHIPVHAGLKMIFLDTLHAPERLERDILRHQDHPPYKKAWEYVQEHDHRHINNQLKNLYMQLAQGRA